MAVYDRVDKSKRMMINRQRTNDLRLKNLWKNGLLPKHILIKFMVKNFISKIEVWWILRKYPYKRR